MSLTNWEWCDPHSPGYRRDIFDEVRAISRGKAYTASQEWGISVYEEDLEQGLLLHLVANPSLLASEHYNRTKILAGEATKLCFESRRQAGGFIIGADQLDALLLKWHSEGIPQFVEAALYSEKFAAMGMPAGKYFEVITGYYLTGAYEVGNRSSASGKNLLRSVERLAELMNQHASLDSVEHLTAVAGDAWEPEATTEAHEELIDDTDFERIPGKYLCTQGHVTAHDFFCGPPRTIGSRNGVYGLRYCPCGSVLSLLA